MRIKTIGIKYPQKRLVMNKVPGVEYRCIQNYVNPLLKHFGQFEVWKPFFDVGVTGYHTVNTIMLTSKPWCVSFEDYVPRGSLEDFWKIAYWGHDIPRPCKRIDYMLEAVAKDNCKRLMALSECNLKMQRHFYRNYCIPEVADKLNAKTILLKVPQQTLVDKAKLQVDGKVKFIFVGNDFFRKGGLEMIEAFYELRKNRQDFELYLITKLESNSSYPLRQYQDSVDVMQRIRRMVFDAKDWIYYKSDLPNLEVLNMIKKCDVGLLPTWHDTYGYSVLEMEACGVPVITTNIRALQETNANGWHVNLDINHNNEVLIMSEETKKKTRATMIKQLISVINTVLDQPEVIHEKGQASLDYIHKFHDPDNYSRSLTKIYREFV
jgi:glycosyltransferase involved in cell wall biosynthesis